MVLVEISPISMAIFIGIPITIRIQRLLSKHMLTLRVSTNTFTESEARPSVSVPIRVLILKFADAREWVPGMKGKTGSRRVHM